MSLSFSANSIAITNRIKRIRKLWGSSTRPVGVTCHDPLGIIQDSADGRNLQTKNHVIYDWARTGKDEPVMVKQRDFMRVIEVDRGSLISLKQSIEQ